jgi:OOP family OmpA-OmpF porin
MRRLLPFALTTAVAPAAFADEQPSADLRGTFAPLHHDAGITIESVRSPGTGETTAAVRISYAFRPVVLRGTDGEIAAKIVEHQFTGDFVASVGLFERLTLGLDLPVVLGQTGDEVTAGSDLARFIGTEPPPLTALGDLGIRLKGTIVQPDIDEVGLTRGFGLAADERFTVPTGDERSFIGEGGIASETRIYGELSHGPILGSLRAGVKLRAEPGAYACNPDEPLDACDSRFGHELPLAFGLALRPQGLGVDPDGIVTIYAETRGYLPIHPVQPFEAGAPAGWFASLAGRFAFGDVALLAGVEVGLRDGVGNAPFRGTLGVSVAPRASDQDRDGQPDDDDKCPTFAEDRDGNEDSDGCPEMDDDGDGVPDALDRCPAIPGNGGDAGDGCPAA